MESKPYLLSYITYITYQQFSLPLNPYWETQTNVIRSHCVQFQSILSKNHENFCIIIKSNQFYQNVFLLWELSCYYPLIKIYLFASQVVSYSLLKRYKIFLIFGQNMSILAIVIEPRESQVLCVVIVALFIWNHSKNHHRTTQHNISRNINCSKRLVAINWSLKLYENYRGQRPFISAEMNTILAKT